MAVITLLGESLAREGEIFVYTGYLKECKECKLKTVCFNLDEGRRYRVVAVREKHHDCPVFEGGVRVVEVEPVALECAMDAKKVVEGMVITYSRKACNRLGCENYILCKVQGTRKGQRYRILKVLGDLDCPKGKRLKKVLLEWETGG